jgi:ABC-type phosphate transport system permease subunit
MYFAFGIVFIVLIFLFLIKDSKKKIDSGEGDKIAYFSSWGDKWGGKPVTHEQSYYGGIITLVIFILVALYAIFLD